LADITSVHQLIDAAMDLGSSWGHETWWRGHGDDGWDLVPAVYRRHRGDSYEHQIVHRFMRQARIRHPRCPAHDDHAGWLFLMQHYRLPTRLLDWSESPLVALFFAIRSHAENAGAIWAIKPFGLNEAQVGEGAIMNPRDPKAQAVILPAFGQIRKPSMSCLAIYPEEIDQRLAMQLSTFTVHGESVPLNQLPRAPEFVKKFTVPREAKEPLARTLDALGVRRANLFPDLENLAAQLADLEF
jgi:hypothetical protein